MNATLLKQTFGELVRHPDTWDQGDWRECFAAHVVLSQGGRWVTDDITEEASLAVVATADEIEVCQQRFFLLPSGEVVEGVWVWERACRLLGITQRQGRRLFAPTNTLDHLRQLIHDMCEVAAA